jgi:hypothetical protein
MVIGHCDHYLCHKAETAGVTAKCLALMLFIFRVLGLNLSPQAHYTDQDFLGLLIHFLQGNSGMIQVLPNSNIL